jgi:hypothetical protein
MCLTPEFARKHGVTERYVACIFASSKKLLDVSTGNIHHK